MADVLVTTTNRNVIVNERSIDVVVQDNVIQVDIIGGRGPVGADGARYKSLVYNTFDGETTYIGTTVQMSVDTGLAWTVGQRARLSKVVGIGIQYIEGFVTSYRDIVGTMTLSVRCDNQTTGIYEYTGGTCYVNLIGEVGASGAPGAAAELIGYSATLGSVTTATITAATHQISSVKNVTLYHPDGNEVGVQFSVISNNVIINSNINLLNHIIKIY